MEKYKKRQEEGFQELKKILKDKGTTETIEGYIRRLEAMFSGYVVMDLNWDKVLSRSRELTGDTLERFILDVVNFVEFYDE